LNVNIRSSVENIKDSPIRKVIKIDLFKGMPKTRSVSGLDSKYKPYLEADKIVER